MDNLALSVSKSITEFLEHNEKRFVTQLSQQEQHNKAIEQFQARIETLESKCEDLTNQNTYLRDELEAVKKREIETNKDLITTKSDLERMQKSVTECEQWVQLMGALTGQVHNLMESREALDKELKDMHNNQTELNKLLERQQRQISSTAATASKAIAAASCISKRNNNSPMFNGNRVPVRSPSTSSFLSNNFHDNHNQMHTPIQPRYSSNHQSPTNHQYNNHLPKDDFLGPIDPNYELIEISEDAESLIKGVNALNDLHRSFERNSICSGD